MYNYNCKNCNKAFLSKKKTSLFCSLICSQKYRKQGSMVKCKYCTKSFYLNKARLNKQYYFCSPEHHNLFQSRNKVHYDCKICSKPCVASPSTFFKRNVKYCSLQCRDKDPDVKKQLHKMCNDQQKIKINKFEQYCYNLLDSLHIDYEPQASINDKICVDALLPKYNLVLQFDGDYWHGNPTKFKELDHRQQARVNRDKSQDAYLRKCGYKILRFWQSDIKADEYKNFITVVQNELNYSGTVQRIRS